MYAKLAKVLQFRLQTTFASNHWKHTFESQSGHGNFCLCHVHRGDPYRKLTILSTLQSVYWSFLMCKSSLVELWIFCSIWTWQNMEVGSKVWSTRTIDLSSSILLFRCNLQLGGQIHLGDRGNLGCAWLSTAQVALRIWNNADVYRFHP